MKLQQKQIKPLERGCGTRKQGKAYLVSDVKKYLEQYPFSYFLFDPPIVINPADWGLTPISMSYIFNDGYWHIVDWIGNDYPNASDILEEAFVHGGSALTPLKQDFQKLTPGYSRRLLVHPKGSVSNPEIIKENRIHLNRISHCFLQPDDYRYALHESKTDPSYCASLHWQHVIDKNIKERKQFTRKIGDTTYPAISISPYWKLDYEVAIIGWLPIDEIHLVESEDKTELDKAIDFLQEFSNLPIYLTNS